MLTFDHLWQLGSALVLLLFGWLIRDMKADIKKANDAAEAAEADAENTRRDLEKHKLYAAETYARKPDVDRAVEAMEKRLREQIRDQGERQLEVMEEIRDRLPARK